MTEGMSHQHRPGWGTGEVPALWGEVPTHSPCFLSPWSRLGQHLSKSCPSWPAMFALEGRLWGWVTDLLSWHPQWSPGICALDKHPLTLENSHKAGCFKITGCFWPCFCLLTLRGSETGAARGESGKLTPRVMWWFFLPSHLVYILPLSLCTTLWEVGFMTSPLTRNHWRSERPGEMMQSGKAGGWGPVFLAVIPSVFVNLSSGPRLTRFPLFSTMASPQMGKARSSFVLNWDVVLKCW